MHTDPPSRDPLWYSCPPNMIPVGISSSSTIPKPQKVILRDCNKILQADLLPCSDILGHLIRAGKRSHIVQHCPSKRQTAVMLGLHLSFVFTLMTRARIPISGLAHAHVNIQVLCCSDAGGDNIQDLYYKC